MDNFITNIKNKLMVPSSRDEDNNIEKMKKSTPLIPMPDIDDMTSAAARAEAPAQDVSQIQNEQEKTAEDVPTESSFNVLIKSLATEEKKEEEPKHIPNPIEDDIFIQYYD